MFQAIFIGVVGFLIFSVFQTVRRGKVTPEGRKNNPTLLENLKVQSDGLNESLSVKLAETNFEADYCQWFRTFRNSVSMILEHAEHKSTLDEKLEANPELARIFDEIMSEREPENKVNHLIPAKAWVKDGQPSMPQVEFDPTLVQPFKSIFADHVKRHEKFVEETKQKLMRNPGLRKIFEEEMTDRGMMDIHQKYFQFTAP